MSSYGFKYNPALEYLRMNLMFRYNTYYHSRIYGFQYKRLINSYNTDYLNNPVVMNKAAPGLFYNPLYEMLNIEVINKFNIFKESRKLNKINRTRYFEHYKFTSKRKQDGGKFTIYPKMNSLDLYRKHPFNIYESTEMYIGHNDVLDYNLHIDSDDQMFVAPPRPNITTIIDIEEIFQDVYRVPLLNIDALWRGYMHTNSVENNYLYRYVYQIINIDNLLLSEFTNIVYTIDNEHIRNYNNNIFTVDNIYLRRPDHRYKTDGTQYYKTVFKSTDIGNSQTISNEFIWVGYYYVFHTITGHMETFNKDNDYTLFNQPSFLYKRYRDLLYREGIFSSKFTNKGDYEYFINSFRKYISSSINSAGNSVYGAYVDFPNISINKQVFVPHVIKKLFTSSLSQSLWRNSYKAYLDSMISVPNDKYAYITDNVFIPRILPNVNYIDNIFVYTYNKYIYLNDNIYAWRPSFTTSMNIMDFIKTPIKHIYTTSMDSMYINKPMINIYGINQLIYRVLPKFNLFNTHEFVYKYDMYFNMYDAELVHKTDNVFSIYKHSKGLLLSKTILRTGLWLSNESLYIYHPDLYRYDFYSLTKNIISSRNVNVQDIISIYRAMYKLHSTTEENINVTTNNKYLYINNEYIQVSKDRLGLYLDYDFNIFKDLFNMNINNIITFVQSDKRTNILGQNIYGKRDSFRITNILGYNLTIDRSIYETNSVAFDNWLYRKSKVINRYTQDLINKTVQDNYSLFDTVHWSHRESKELNIYVQNWIIKTIQDNYNLFNTIDWLYKKYYDTVYFNEVSQAYRRVKILESFGKLYQLNRTYVTAGAILPSSPYDFNNFTYRRFITMGVNNNILQTLDIPKESSLLDYSKFGFKYYKYLFYDNETEFLYKKKNNIFDIKSDFLYKYGKYMQVSNYNIYGHKKSINTNSYSVSDTITVLPKYVNTFKQPAFTLKIISKALWQQHMIWVYTKDKYISNTALGIFMKIKDTPVSDFNNLLWLSKYAITVNAIDIYNSTFKYFKYLHLDSDDTNNAYINSARMLKTDVRYNELFSAKIPRYVSIYYSNAVIDNARMFITNVNDKELYPSKTPKSLMEAQNYWINKMINNAVSFEYLFGHKSRLSLSEHPQVSVFKDVHILTRHKYLFINGSGHDINEFKNIWASKSYIDITTLPIISGIKDRIGMELYTVSGIYNIYKDRIGMRIIPAFYSVYKDRISMTIIPWSYFVNKDRISISLYDKDIPQAYKDKHSMDYYSHLLQAHKDRKSFINFGTSCDAWGWKIRKDLYSVNLLKKIEQSWLHLNKKHTMIQYKNTFMSHIPKPTTLSENQITLSLKRGLSASVWSIAQDYDIISFTKNKKDVMIQYTIDHLKKGYKRGFIESNMFSSVIPKSNGQIIDLELFCDKEGHQAFIDYVNENLIKSRIIAAAYHSYMYSKKGQKETMIDYASERFFNNGNDKSQKYTFLWYESPIWFTYQIPANNVISGEWTYLNRYHAAALDYQDEWFSMHHEASYHPVLEDFVIPNAENTVVMPAEIGDIYKNGRPTNILYVEPVDNPDRKHRWTRYPEKEYIPIDRLNKNGFFQSMDTFYRKYYEAKIHKDDFGNWVWAYETPDPFDKDPFGIDELLLPENDTRYEEFTDLVFNRETNRPRNPVKKIDDNTWIAKLPTRHPFKNFHETEGNVYVGITKDQYFGVRTGIMHAVFLKYYHLWQAHLFEFSTMNMVQSAKAMLEWLYAWIHVYFPVEDLPEALRVFRQVRWYSEKAVLNNSQYIVSGEWVDLPMLEIPNNLATNDTMYYDANLGVYRNNPAYINVYGAGMEFYINTHKDTTVKFSLINTVGSVNIYIDDELVDTLSNTTRNAVYPIRYFGDTVTLRIEKEQASNINNQFMIGAMSVEGIKFDKLNVEFDPLMRTGNKPMAEITKKMIAFANLADDIEETYEKLKRDNLSITVTINMLLDYWKYHHEAKNKGKRLTIKKV